MKDLSRRQMLRLTGGAAAVTGAAAMTGVSAGPARATSTAPSCSPLDLLKKELGSKVLFPGDPDYDAERTGFNLTVDHHPKAIVLVEDDRDVAISVRCAAALRWPVAVQATGHGIGVPADGALFINSRKMTGVRVDPERRTAWADAGVRWAAVLPAAAPFGLAPLVGTTPDVSVVGYTGGGGLPVIGRATGYTADHVRSFRMVTPDGRIRDVSPDRHADLFWGVRGGKSNFGMVTSIEVELLPIATLYGGQLTFPGALGATVLKAYQQWTAALPEQMSSSLTVLQFPDDPSLPPPLRGRRLLTIDLAFVGTAADGDRLLAPLRALHPIQDSVKELPYSQIGSIYNDSTKPVPAYERSGMIRRLDDEALARFASVVGPDVTLPPGIISIRHLGGVLGRRPAVPNAIGHRDAEFLLLLADIGLPGDVEAVKQFEQSVIDRMSPSLTGGRFPNFLSSTETSTALVRTAYTDEDWERLVRLKDRYDPHNMFRINHNIPPSR